MTDTLTQDHITHVFEGLLILVGAAVRVPLGTTKKAVLKEDLEYLNIPADHVPAIIQTITGAKYGSKR